MRWDAIWGCVLAVSLVGCQTTGPKEQFGTLAGAGAGALIGSQFGKGDGQIAGTLIGAAIGGFIGNRIGASLDEADRQSLARITRQAAVSGGASHFHNRRTGVSGTARVTNTATNSNGSVCRTVEQEVTLKDGSVTRDTVSACKGRNGWEL